MLKTLEEKYLGSSKGLIQFGVFLDDRVLHSQRKGLPKKQYGYLFMIAGILLLKPMDKFETQCWAIKPHAQL